MIKGIAAPRHQRLTLILARHSTAADEIAVAAVVAATPATDPEERRAGSMRSQSQSSLQLCGSGSTGRRSRGLSRELRWI